MKSGGRGAFEEHGHGLAIPPAQMHPVGQGLCSCRTRKLSPPSLRAGPAIPPNADAFQISCRGDLSPAALHCNLQGIYNAMRCIGATRCTLQFVAHAATGISFSAQKETNALKVKGQWEYRIVCPRAHLSLGYNDYRILLFFPCVPCPTRVTPSQSMILRRLMADFTCW